MHAAIYARYVPVDIQSQMIDAQRVLINVVDTLRRPAP